MPKDYDPETMDPWVANVMVDQVAHAIEEGRSYFIQLPHGGKAEFLRAVAERLEQGDPEGAVSYYHYHSPSGGDGDSYHAHPGGDRAHHHDAWDGEAVFDVEGQRWQEVISNSQKQRGPRYRQEGSAEVYERRVSEPDDDPDHLGSTHHSHEHPDGKGHSHSHVNGWWPHRHNPDSGRAAYGGMKRVTHPDHEQRHERYWREPRGTVEVWEYQPLTERQTEHAHEVSPTEGYTHTHAGGHTDHDHSMNEPVQPGRSWHESWGRVVEDIQDASGVAAAFVHPVSGEMDEGAQRIYDEAHRKPDDPWPGESYEGTSLRDLLEGYMRLGVVKLPDRNYPFGEFDAKVWAEEFLDHFEHRPDLGTLIAWFANAIMTGYDEGRRREQRWGRVDPIEVDDEGNVTHPGPLRPEEPEHWSWVDRIADVLAEHYGLEPSDRKWPDAKVEGTPEELAGAVYRALLPDLAQLERAAHPLHEAQAWGEAQQAKRRVAELEEFRERAQKQLDDCWRLRSLAEAVARQRIPNEAPSAWTHVRRDTMNQLREYLGIDLEAEERERQEHMEYAEWEAEQEADARSTRLGEEGDDG